MSTGTMVRPLKNRSEEKKFASIALYCFNDRTGWTGRTFPLKHGDRAWGVFNGGTLESGLVTRAYQARVFGASRPLSGVSLVETPPEYRNRSNISALFERVLPYESEHGMVVSALYPFSFPYYGRYGYGLLGGPVQARFTPESVAVDKPATGEFRAFDGSPRDIRAYYALCETWTERFSFGIRPRPLPVKAFLEELAWSGDYIVFYSRGNAPVGMVRFNKNIVEQFVSDLDIRKIAWLDDAAFRALLYLVKTHRNQIRDVRWYMPSRVPLALLMKEPRIQLSLASDWMVRPLDLPELVRLKAKACAAAEEIVFSVKDDLLPRNTGTYRIEGDQVTIKKPDGSNPLSLPLLSSLLCGGCSLGEARLAGAIGPDTLRNADDFFTRDRNIFLNEFF